MSGGIGDRVASERPAQAAGTLDLVRVAPPPPRINSRLRGTLLMPICVLAVHQLRYYLAYGSHASAHLAASGHAYLSTAEPFALLGVALAVGALVGRLSLAWQKDAVRAPGRPLPRIWALCALTLLALYCCQELAEGMFAGGHGAGLAGIVGYGGWIALPAAAAIGGALALALRAADRLVALVAGLRSRPPLPRAAALPVRFTRHAAPRWRLEPLSGVSASRGPPHPLSL